MKNLFTFFLLSTLLLSSGCGEEACGEDTQSLDAYLDANNITPTEDDDSDLRYIIDEAGGEEKPTLTDSVTIRYTGTLTNGEVFDQTGNGTATFLLRNLIEGWQIGIPLIGRGGRIQLFIPADLAYGNRQVACIRPNSDLIFDVELLDFTD